MGNSRSGICILLLLFAFIAIGCKRGKSSSKLEPGTISSPLVEYACSLSASGDALYFARSDQRWGDGNMKSSIYYSVKKKGKWSSPELASFSGKYDDSDPYLTQDGNTLYFISQRPFEDIPISADIWRVKKSDNGNWGEPMRLPNPINSTSTEFSPRIDGKGNLYFASDRPGGLGQGDLYIAQISNGQFSDPQNMGNTINSSKGEWNLEINDSGDVLIFEASQRKQNVSSYGDLYISFKQGTAWTIPQNIKELNTSGSDLYPFLGKDEGFLYYTSSDSLKGQNTDIYFTEFPPIYDNYKAQAKSPLHYLFVVNRSSHDLALIDVSGQKLVKKIPVGIGPHEITISKDNRYAFVANYGSYPKPHSEPITAKELQWIDDPQHTITKIDLSNLSTQTFTIPGSSAYHGILTNQDGSLVWITAENEGIVKEIDGNHGNVLKAFTTMPGSHIMKSTPDFASIFVSNIASNTISVIDRARGSVTNIKVPEGPEGLEISPDGQFLWVLCNTANKVVVLNTKTLEQVAAFDSRGKFPIKLTFVKDEAWVGNVFSHNIAIFNASTFAFKEHLELESSPLGIASHHDKVFVTLPRKNTVRVLDAQSRKKLIDYSYGMEPDGLGVVHDVEGHMQQ